MIKLINGRGQLGDRLRSKLLDYSDINEEIYIYHTWRMNTKLYDEQLREYEKFKNFVNDHKESKIILVSTYCDKDNWYVHFKQLSEAYLLSSCPKGIAIRVPTFIGKGKHCAMFDGAKLKKGLVKPFGTMRLIAVEDVADKVLELCRYNGHLKTIQIDGETVSAKLIFEIYKIMGIVE
jgi:hypothetical protein